MKKLVLMIAFLACSGIIMAQHYDLVNQTGEYNESTVTQLRNQEAAGLVGNSAWVDQIGYSNNNILYQNNNGYGGGGQKAWI